MRKSACGTLQAAARITGGNRKSYQSDGEYNAPRDSLRQGSVITCSFFWLIQSSLCVLQPQYFGYSAVPLPVHGRGASQATDALNLLTCNNSTAVFGIILASGYTGSPPSY
jgi:hypothetical protein